MNSKWLNGFALVAVALAAALLAFANRNSNTSTQLLNVSYDATRELYKDLNEKFVAKFQKETGRTLSIRQSHGESANQAQAVIAGLKADVVTLAVGADIDALHTRGLVPEGWAKRLPHDSQPYSSTIVFVVRKGNPKAIADWPDLVKPGVAVVSSNLEASGDSRFGMMAAWGSVVYRGGDEERAREFLKQLRTHLLILDAGPTGAAKTFSEQKLGDLHLTWENEALAETDNAKGDLQIVYPPVSIRAEPSVAWVDADVAGTPREACAKAYLEFLYTAQAQETIAQHDLRPWDAAVLKRHSARLPELNLFPAAAIARNFAKNWEEVQVATR